MALNETKFIANLDESFNTKEFKEIQEKSLQKITFNKPNSGWGWVVVLSSFITISMCDGYLFSSSNQFYEIFLKEYQCPEWIAATCVSILTCSVCFVSPFATGWISHFGCQFTSHFGTFVVITGLFLTVIFDQSIFYHWITFGIVIGTGIGIMLICAVTTLNEWFDTKNAFALGLAMSGSGVGMALFTILTWYLIESFGWRDAQIILAGVFSLLLALNSLDSPPIMCHEVASRHRGLSCINKDKFNLSLLKNNEEFLYFVISNIVLSTAAFTPLIVTSDRIRKWGLGENVHAMQVMVWFGLGNTIGRVFFAIIVSKDHSPMLLYLLSSFVWGFILLLSPFSKSITQFSILYFFFGIFFGANVYLTPIVVSSILSSKVSSKAYGVLCFFNGFGSLFGPPVLDAIIAKFWPNSIDTRIVKINKTNISNMSHKVYSIDVYAHVIIVCGFVVMFSSCISIYPFLTNWLFNIKRRSLYQIKIK